MRTQYLCFLFIFNALTCAAFCEDAIETFRKEFSAEGDALQSQIENSSAIQAQSYYTLDQGKLVAHLLTRSGVVQQKRTFVFYKLELLSPYGVPTPATGYGTIRELNGILTLQITYPGELDLGGRPLVDEVEVGRIIGNRIVENRGYNISPRKMRANFLEVANSWYSNDDRSVWFPVVSFDGRRNRGSSLTQMHAELEKLAARLKLIEGELSMKDLFPQDKSLIDKAIISDNYAMEQLVFSILLRFEEHSYDIPAFVLKRLLRYLKPSELPQIHFGHVDVFPSVRAAGEARFYSDLIEMPKPLILLRVVTEIIESSMFRNLLVRQHSGDPTLVLDYLFNAEDLLIGAGEVLQIQEKYNDNQREAMAPAEILANLLNTLFRIPGFHISVNQSKLNRLIHQARSCAGSVNAILAKTLEQLVE